MVTECSRSVVALDPFAQADEEESGEGERGGHAESVADDEKDAEGRTPQGSGAEEHDEGGGAGDEAARDAHADEAGPARTPGLRGGPRRAWRVGVIVVMVVVRRGRHRDRGVGPEFPGRCGTGPGGWCGRPVVVRAVVIVAVASVAVAVMRAVVMVVVVRPAPDRAQEEPEADARDEEATGGVEPQQDGLACQMGGGREGQAEDEDACGVGEGDGGADREGVPSGASAARQVGGHDGLAVAGHRPRGRRRG